MMHRDRLRARLGRARPVTGLALLVLCTLVIVAFVAMVDGRASALWSPLSPLESPLSPLPTPSRAEEHVTPTALPPEPTQTKPAQVEAAQTEEPKSEAAQAAAMSTDVRQSPAWRSLIGIGLVVLGLALVIGGVFWLVRRR